MKKIILLVFLLVLVSVVFGQQQRFYGVGEGGDQCKQFRDRIINYETQLRDQSLTHEERENLDLGLMDTKERLRRCEQSQQERPEEPPARPPVRVQNQITHSAPKGITTQEWHDWIIPIYKNIDNIVCSDLQDKLNELSGLFISQPEGKIKNQMNKELANLERKLSELFPNGCEAQTEQPPTQQPPVSIDPFLNDGGFLACSCEGPTQEEYRTGSGNVQKIKRGNAIRVRCDFYEMSTFESGDKTIVQFFGPNPLASDESYSFSFNENELSSEGHICGCNDLSNALNGLNNPKFQLMSSFPDGNYIPISRNDVEVHEEGVNNDKRGKKMGDARNKQRIDLEQKMGSALAVISSTPCEGRETGFRTPTPPDALSKPPVQVAVGLPRDFDILELLDRNSRGEKLTPQELTAIQTFTTQMKSGGFLANRINSEDITTDKKQQTTATGLTNFVKLSFEVILKLFNVALTPLSGKDLSEEKTSADSGAENSCGNGVLDEGEECDIQLSFEISNSECVKDNQVGICSSTCECRTEVRSKCGDGVVSEGREICDPGKDLNGELPGNCFATTAGVSLPGNCRSSGSLACQRCEPIQVCGNRNLELPTEACDPPGEPCRKEIRGFSYWDAEEKSLKYESGSKGGICASDCGICQVCGDGILDPNEECDPGEGSSCSKEFTSASGQIISTPGSCNNKCQCITKQPETGTRTPPQTIGTFIGGFNACNSCAQITFYEGTRIVNVVDTCVRNSCGGTCLVDPNTKEDLTERRLSPSGGIIETHYTVMYGTCSSPTPTQQPQTTPQQEVGFQTPPAIPKDTTSKPPVQVAVGLPDDLMPDPETMAVCMDTNKESEEIKKKIAALEKEAAKIGSLLTPSSITTAVIVTGLQTLTGAVTLEELNEQIAALNEQLNALQQNVCDPNFYRDLRVGLSGTDVTRLQNYLNQAGYFNYPSTGYFGLKTEAAVRKFQQDQGFSPTGFFGPKTRAKLLASLPAADINLGVTLVNTLTVSFEEIIDVTVSADISGGESYCKEYIDGRVEAGFNTDQGFNVQTFPTCAGRVAFKATCIQNIIALEGQQVAEITQEICGENQYCFEGACSDKSSETSTGGISITCPNGQCETGPETGTSSGPEYIQVTIPGRTQTYPRCSKQNGVTEIAISQEEYYYYPDIWPSYCYSCPSPVQKEPNVQTCSTQLETEIPQTSSVDWTPVTGACSVAQINKGCRSSGFICKCPPETGSSQPVDTTPGAVCPSDCRDMGESDGKKLCNCCGNGKIDNNAASSNYLTVYEACDGSNFGGATCATEKGSGYEGSLSCITCQTIVTSACTQRPDSQQCAAGETQSCDSTGCMCITAPEQLQCPPGDTSCGFDTIPQPDTSNYGKADVPLDASTGDDWCAGGTIACGSYGCSCYVNGVLVADASTDNTGSTSGIGGDSGGIGGAAVYSRNYCYWGIFWNSRTNRMECI